MAVTFPNYSQFVEMFNAGYSIFDNASQAASYFAEMTPASAFAGSVAATNFAWSVSATIYNEFITQTQPTQSILSKYYNLGEGLAKIGFPLDLATSVIGLGAIAIDKGVGSQEFQDAALKLALQAGTAAALMFFFGSISAGALAFGLVGLLVDFDRAFLGRAITSPLLKLLTDPLILDLDGDGVEVSALDGSGVHFDFNGDGFAERTGWVSPDDGMLAIDANGNGQIDGGLELFGSRTQDGFAVLETLDTNGDGRIDAEDTRFADLRVWRDLNQNGVSDPGELQTLAQAGVTSISLARTDVPASEVASRGETAPKA